MGKQPSTAPPGQAEVIGPDDVRTSAPDDERSRAFVMVDRFQAFRDLLLDPRSVYPGLRRTSTL
jgi:hypothetical protein